MNFTASYRELQITLKDLRSNGIKVNCKLNQKKEVLQAEVTRIWKEMTGYVEPAKEEPKQKAPVKKITTKKPAKQTVLSYIKSKQQQTEKMVNFAQIGKSLKLTPKQLHKEIIKLSATDKIEIYTLQEVTNYSKKDKEYIYYENQSNDDLEFSPGFFFATLA
jgi:hypothetical protein